MCLLEAIIQTEIICNKIPCYMHDSSCKWCIAKNKTKTFWGYVQNLWGLAG